MEIAAIKQALSIEAVLQHYGLKADRNHRLHCPFHNDKTPSLQIYPTTNTYCCFSTNCKAGTGDVIQFIQLKESCSKRQALVKATALAGENNDASMPAPSAKLFIKTDALDKIAVLTKVFSYYRSGMRSSKKAIAYLESRSLNYKLCDVAFNSGGLHLESKNHYLIESMVRHGLLKPRPAGGYNVWARECVLFPLRNAANKIVSLYGRSISNDKEQRHFYLSGREGLYPHYPKPATQKLILTESIIDAESLLQQQSITKQYAVLALFGTNGLTDEHLQAIVSLQFLEEIILMLDADDVGRATTEKHAVTLKALLPEVRITAVQLPDGEDVNSVLCSHDDTGVLLSLIEARTDFFVSIEKEKSTTVVATSHQASSRLVTANPELLLYDMSDLHIEVLGGIKITGLDRLRVTLKIVAKGKTTLPVWHSLDLYNHSQREQAINSLAESFELGTRTVMQALAELTSELERYRLARIEALQPKQEALPEMSATQKQAAVNELKKPNLLQRTSQLIAMSGIVSEATNSLIAYLVYSTRKQSIPLHVMFLGASGSGKTYLQEKISELMPEEDKIEITQITENALYYFKQHELQNKLILIEDLDGATSVFYPLRELQTKRRISKTVTLKDSKGNLKTITLTVEGPVSVSGCTTREKLYEDNANRCILLYTDQSTEQDKRINQYQAKVAAGEVNRTREEQYKELFRNMQRMLRPITVINPYAKYLELPDLVFKPRRTMTLLLGFIEAIAFYHQYQREVKKDASGLLYIETTVSDIEAAFALLKDVLFSKSDELTRATRSFFERLKAHINEHQQTSFKMQDVRRVFRMEPRTVQRYMKELSQYGCIKRTGGHRGRTGFEYMIAETEEYSRLTKAIDGHIESVLEAVRTNATMRN
jgi:DNA primase/predicted transcriptional regulator